MDEYQHLRESADARAKAEAEALFNDHGYPLIGFADPEPIRHMQGIPPRDYRDEDRAQEARREANLSRQRAFYNVEHRRVCRPDRARVLRDMRGDYR